MGETLVDTRAGKLRGLTQDGIHRFAGIPYGAPTGGERRFLPALPAAPWSGVRDATEFGPICPQQGSLVDPALSDANVTGAVRYLPQSEDCLVLNVWTPGAARRPAPPGHGVAARRRLHGGRRLGALVRRRPSSRAAATSVVVTVNHRLNAFGYLHLTDALGEEFSGVRGRGHARRGARARVGARQHRGVRRRSEQRDDLRRVGRRREGEHHAGAARGEGPVPPRGGAERAGTDGGRAQSRARVHRAAPRPARDPARGRAQAPAPAARADLQGDQQAAGSRPGHRTLPDGHPRDVPALPGGRRQTLPRAPVHADRGAQRRQRAAA